MPGQSHGTSATLAVHPDQHVVLRSLSIGLRRRERGLWTSTRPGGFGGNDIWTSRRINGEWSPAQNLGSTVNGPGSEHHSIPTPRAPRYLTSDRVGGFGADDIYIAARDSNGQWGSMTNAGATPNGPGNDRCGSWTPDGEIFLFDSIEAPASAARTCGGPSPGNDGGPRLVALVAAIIYHPDHLHRSQATGAAPDVLPILVSRPR